MSTTNVTGGNAACVVATTRLGLGNEQGLLRSRAGELDEVRHARAATARSGGLVLADTHWYFVPSLAAQATGPVKMSM